MQNTEAAINLTYSTTFKLGFTEIDRFSRLRLGTLINMLIQTGIEAATQLGVGVDICQQQGLSWVLSRLSVEIYRPLLWHENLRIESWSKGLDRIMYLRDFFIYDQTNTIVAKATSGWLVIDINSRRPRIISSDASAGLTQMKGIHALTYPPQKLFQVKEGNTFTIYTTYFDIDFNGHVTTTRYIDWMMDSFSIDYHAKHYPSHISVNFMNECKQGEVVHLIRSNTNINSFVFEGLNQTLTQIAYRGSLEFSPIEQSVCQTS